MRVHHREINHRVVQSFFSKAQQKATFESNEWKSPWQAVWANMFPGLVPTWSLIAMKGPWELPAIPYLQGLWVAAHAKHQDHTNKNHNPEQSQVHKTLSLSQVGKYCVISHPESSNIHLINPFLQCWVLLKLPFYLLSFKQDHVFLFKMQVTKSKCTSSFSYLHFDSVISPND